MTMPFGMLGHPPLPGGRITSPGGPESTPYVPPVPGGRTTTPHTPRLPQGDVPPEPGGSTTLPHTPPPHGPPPPLPGGSAMTPGGCVKKPESTPDVPPFSERFEPPVPESATPPHAGSAAALEAIDRRTYEVFFLAMVRSSSPCERLSPSNERAANEPEVFSQNPPRACQRVPVPAPMSRRID